MGRGFGSGGSGIGSGVGDGGWGSGTGGRGSGVGCTCMVVKDERDARSGVPFAEEEGLARLPEEWRASVRRDIQYLPMVDAIQTNTNSICAQGVQNVWPRT
jgi:hypothetical protein